VTRGAAGFVSVASRRFAVIRYERRCLVEPRRRVGRANRANSDIVADRGYLLSSVEQIIDAASTKDFVTSCCSADHLTPPTIRAVICELLATRGEVHSAAGIRDCRRRSVPVAPELCGRARRGLRRMTASPRLR
jgi:hypothetical protein